jgi:hypothetical protein
MKTVIFVLCIEPIRTVTVSNFRFVRLTIVTLTSHLCNQLLPHGVSMFFCCTGQLARGFQVSQFVIACRTFK